MGYRVRLGVVVAAQRQPRATIPMHGSAFETPETDVSAYPLSCVSGQKVCRVTSGRPVVAR